MLRIVDELAGRGPLRICAHVPPPGGPGDLTGLRVLLVADVLARVVELRGRHVLLGRTGPGVPSAAAVGIRPSDADGTPDHIADMLGGPPGVHLTNRAYEGGGGASLQVAEAHTSVSPAGLEERDPLAVRLLLLSHAHHEPTALRAEALDEARLTLARWRRAVADWAEQPSMPMPMDLLRPVRAGLEDGLGTPAVLDLLRDLETDTDVPAGAKFETFAHLDRVLGLELARETGRPHPAGAPA
ncbi:hypothetical protein J7E87_04090 [Streptomyces sp. ISL-1]|uniref:hypothetical protein n=1 Tax=Streptomyces sp. ISL-1 TaxID=2817657 RepID=UPI001BE971BA|nr:hypothetical protein [Streptomyces sp. ISL-1]MBT2388616.1 hypothetical protein [Streptomyces sp. ISL-1]